MTARKFSPTQEAELARRYEAGESSSSLARKHGTSPGVILRTIRRAGVTVRGLKDAQRPKLSPQQVDAICCQYAQGLSTVQLAAQYGVCDHTVAKALRARGVHVRNYKESGKIWGKSLLALDEQQQAQLCKGYLEGKTSWELANQFQIGQATACRILERHGVERRSTSEAKTGRCLKLNPDEIREAVRLYVDEKLGASEIGRRFGVSEIAVRAYVEKAGHTVRTWSQARALSRKLTTTQVAEIVSRYKRGEHTTALAAAFEVSDPCIGQALRRAGVQMRTSGEAKAILTPEQIAECVDLYAQHYTLQEIGERFGVNRATVGRVLKLEGVEIRPQGGSGGGDTLEAALEGSERFAEEVETFAYVFAMRRHPGLVKIGIAKVVEDRVDDEYGDLLEAWLLTDRTSAFFLEQALLAKTLRHQPKVLPKTLQDWPGWSEIRELPEDQVLGEARFLLSRLEELGPWAFAREFVPMSPHLQQRCTERHDEEMSLAAA